MRRTSTLVSLCVLLVASGFLLAGPLTPPAGPIVPTGKTLVEVEPRTPVSPTTTPGDADSVFRISQPGSYYLTGNVAGAAGKHGIEIAASAVTLDLNGFDVRGVANSLDGVSVTELGLSNIEVVNGTVRDWGESGVDVSSSAPGNIRLLDLRASNNATSGIAVGASATILRCASNNNVGAGIVGGAGSVISDCSVTVNGADGIATGSGCTITNNAVRSNRGDGIDVLGECLIMFNACTRNGNGTGDGAGIHAQGSRNRIEANTCTDADRGIDVDGTNNVVIRNSCLVNTTNWDIAAGNAVGPIVLASTNAAAIVGNTYAGSLGTTDPNANFSR